MTTFGDKIRKLRKEKKMTQQKLGAMVGVSYRTIRSWEVEGRYPKQSSLYQKLADAFQCQVSYLMNDNETVCLGNDEPSEYAGAKQARQILEQVAALFASGTMTNEDKTIFMDEMTRLYLASKKENVLFSRICILRDWYRYLLDRLKSHILPSRGMLFI